MPCFLACFNASKHQTRPKSAHPTPQSRVTASPRAQSTEKTDDGALVWRNPEPPEKLIEKPNWGKKRVAFDLNVEIYEVLPAEEEYIDDGVERTGRVESLKEEAEPKRESTSLCGSAQLLPSVLTRASNYRYHNCTNSDDELDGVETEGSTEDEDEHTEAGVGVGERDAEIAIQESSESLFSISIDSIRHGYSAVEAGEREVNSPCPTRTSNQKVVDPFGVITTAGVRRPHLDSVLSPVENLPQWKAVEARATPSLKHQEKENISTEDVFLPVSPELTLTTESHISKPHTINCSLTPQEIAVDASLSSWLVNSETTTAKSTSSTNSVGNPPLERASTPKSNRRRSILGALAVEELGKLYSHVSPRTSGCQSSYETPILGTVGSYWSHIGKAVDSDPSSLCKGMARTASREEAPENSGSWVSKKQED